MIGAGTFSLTGQVAELGGDILSFAFFLAAANSLFSDHSYFKVSNVYPSAGGSAMIQMKGVGREHDHQCSVSPHGLFDDYR